MLISIIFACIIPRLLSYQLPLDVAGRTYGAGASKQVDHSSKQTPPTNVSTSKQAASASAQAIPVSVKAITHHDLGFKANTILGMGFNGEVIISKDNSKDFYLIEHDDNRYTQKYRKNLPDGIKNYDCFKAIDGDRIFLQNDYSEDTICCNRKLKTLSVMHHEGWLIDCIGDKLFYAQGTVDEEFEAKDWKIVVRQLYEDEQSVPDEPSLGKLQLEEHVTLQPPAAQGWGVGLSICRVKESYAVVENITRSLHIFDARGMIFVIQLINHFINLTIPASDKYKV